MRKYKKYLLIMAILIILSVIVVAFNIPEIIVETFNNINS